MLTSPRYTYLSGLSAAVPPLLAELREELLASFKLNRRWGRTWRTGLCIGLVPLPYRDPKQRTACCMKVLPVHEPCKVKALRRGPVRAHTFQGVTVVTRCR